MTTSTSSRPPVGLPILSGPPPIIESAACRQCAKSFNPLWRRSHACGHCGYEYCSNCISDGQALMPRKAGSSSTSGAFSAIKEELGIGSSKSVGGGYDVENVCTYCLGMLQVTSAKLDILRSLPLKRLKDYLAAYNISCIGPKEKEDFVQAIVKARNPNTGCLSPEAESYYRRNSVPKTINTEPLQSNPPNGQPSRSSSSPYPNRPPPQQARPPPSAYQARPQGYPQGSFRPPPNQARPPPPHSRPPPSQNQYRPPPQQYPRPPPPRPSPAPTPAAPKARTPDPPVPTILSLVSLPKSYLSSLSIGTLKAILYENHVRVDFKQVLEKQELINRVDELIRDERKRLERQRIEEERQAAEERGEVAVVKSPSPNEEAESGGGETSKVPTGPPPEVDRGLCCVCQDEEACLAVVDCGHLAMCAHCSDLIMATTQECPLCRTRIVTPQRLIRIYRV